MCQGRLAKILVQPAKEIFGTLSFHCLVIACEQNHRRSITVSKLVYLNLSPNGKTGHGFLSSTMCSFLSFVCFMGMFQSYIETNLNGSKHPANSLLEFVSQNNNLRANGPLHR